MRGFLSVILAAAIAGMLLSSCATTRIVSSDPSGQIFMDDEFLGTGEAEVSAMGPPHTAVLEVKRNGKILARDRMSRQFRFKTILWGVCSYYTGLYWAWYYPESFRLDLPPDVNPIFGAFKSPWDVPSESVWMRPLRARNSLRK